MKEYFYWFSSKDGTTDYQRVPAEIGRTDICEGDIEPCRNGLHASPTPFDALQYAGGPILWCVELSDERKPHGEPIDKYAARTRKYVQRIDATKILRIFAAKQALSVIDKWESPEIVRAYLEDEARGVDRGDIRAAAWDAAWAAAWDAAWDAARDAARAAARAAAWDAAWAAAWDAAWAAARAAAWAAARDAAWDAARDAAKKQFNDMCFSELDKQENK